MTARRMEGRLALVTGASRGIGRAIAERFAAEGAAVVVNAAQDCAGAEAVAARIVEAGGRCTVAMGDVSDADAAERIVAEAVAALGGLDTLVNNAGIDISDGTEKVADFSIEAWDRVQAVNLRGAFLISKFAIPHILERGGGAILGVGSVAGLTAWKHDAHYNASKAGLHLLMQSIAVDYAEAGIRANCVCPGVIETTMHTDWIETSPDGRELEAEILARHPVGRYGRVEDVAAVAVTLCADENRFLTGALVPVDGGYTAV
ncbi:MAG: glucose 1-dehydrogenase [Thermoleophilia bacterium]|nr:glucose 1-dehydrogenase [Thermoleophilia bacterium]